MAESRLPRRIAPLFTWRSAISDSELPPTTRHCLLALSLYMNERGGSAYPGSARLAHDTGLHIRTVKSCLSEAAQTGWVQVVAKGGAPKDGLRHATVYKAAVPAGITESESHLDWWSDATGQEATGGPDDSDWGSSLPGPVVHGHPISSMNSPMNSPRPDGKCWQWTAVDAKNPTVGRCTLDTGHDGPCEAGAELAVVPERGDLT